MNILTPDTGQTADIAALYQRVFAASEGDAEGAGIGALAQRLMTTTPDGDLFAFAAEENATLLGVILFTRLRYTQDPRSVFVLGPVAVATEHHRRGIGRRLITDGLSGVQAAGVDVAVTYGDPGYYTRFGFTPIPETQVPAPYPLQHPHGWLGQSLSEAPLTPLRGTCTCVPGFADPAFW